jgi:hypothetical protein
LVTIEGKSSLGKEKTSDTFTLTLKPKPTQKAVVELEKAVAGVEASEIA